jgi:signal transduction histidine kinase
MIGEVLRAATFARQRSLRARVTMTTTVGLAIALAAAALLLRGALQGSLTREVDGSAQQGAHEVAALAEANRLPRTLLTGTLTVQVLGATGQVVDASATADRLVPLLPPAQAAALARSGRAVLLDGRPFGIPYLRVVAVLASGGEIVLAGAVYTQVRDSMMTLTRALLVGTPLLLLLLAGVTWLVVGSTLRPISALRRGAQVITATGVTRELPVPQARDEVRVLAVTLNDMLARLDAAQQRQRRLVSDTAHELRSPIASIRAQLEVALDHPGQQDWPQTAQDVLADTLRLSSLAEDLLVLARLDEHQVRPAAGQSVDLAVLVTEEAERSAGGRVPVTARTAGPCVVTGDAEGLRRLLRNLIDNAMRYAKSGVEVAARRGRGGVLTVSDDGPGIPAATQAPCRFVRRWRPQPRWCRPAVPAGPEAIVREDRPYPAGRRTWKAAPACARSSACGGQRGRHARHPAGLNSGCSATSGPRGAGRRPRSRRTAGSSRRWTGGTGASRRGWRWGA